MPCFSPFKKHIIQPSQKGSLSMNILMCLRRVKRTLDSGPALIFLPHPSFYSMLSFPPSLILFRVLNMSTNINNLQNHLYHHHELSHSFLHFTHPNKLFVLVSPSKILLSQRSLAKHMKGAIKPNRHSSTENGEGMKTTRRNPATFIWCLMAPWIMGL